MDLHIHTTASDGSCSPSKVIELAYNCGLAALAITDHDTTEGCAEAIAAGQKRGVKVLAGIEISLDFVDNTHLLGYFPRGFTAEFLEAIETLKRYREERIPKILARLAELGCPVSLEEARKESGNEIIGRPHIARVMLRKKYVRSIQDAFDRFLASNAAAYVRKRKFTPEEALSLILRNGGISVLAHPVTMDMAPDMLEHYVSLWKKAGLRGIETMYSEYSPAQEQFLEQLAQRESLLKSGGTDFHGSSKPKTTIGAGKGNLRVPYEYYEKIVASKTFDV